MAEKEIKIPLPPWLYHWLYTQAETVQVQNLEKRFLRTKFNKLGDTMQQFYTVRFNRLIQFLNLNKTKNKLRFE